MTANYRYVREGGPLILLVRRVCNHRTRTDTSSFTGWHAAITLDYPTLLPEGPGWLAVPKMIEYVHGHGWYLSAQLGGSALQRVGTQGELRNRAVVHLTLRTRMVGPGFEPGNSERMGLQPTAFDRFATPPDIDA